MQWRAQMLHTCGLAMQSTRSDSGWGRRVISLGHAAMVDARAGSPELANLPCRRKMQWGWATTGRNDPNLIRVERIAIPDTITRVAAGQYMVDYSTVPQGAPAFVSRTHFRHRSPITKSFVDTRNSYVPFLLAPTVPVWITARENILNAPMCCVCVYGWMWACVRLDSHASALYHDSFDSF
jgi:hypothetical protein